MSLFSCASRSACVAPLVACLAMACAPRACGWDSTEAEVEEAHRLAGIETPHTPWARPLAGGPVRAYAFVGVKTEGMNTHAREIAELAQRVELDLDVSSVLRCVLVGRRLKGFPNLLGGCRNANAFTFPFFSSLGMLLHRFWAPSGALSWACRMVGRVSCCRGRWYCCVCTRRLDSGWHVSIVLRVDRSSALGFGLSRTGAPAVGKHSAVSRKGCVCGALVCANDFDLLLLGAASVEVFSSRWTADLASLNSCSFRRLRPASVSRRHSVIRARQASLWLPPGRILLSFWACSHCGHLSVYP